MKRLDIIIHHEFLGEVNAILYKHHVGGMSFYDVKGRGREKQPEVQIGRGPAKYVPAFGSHTKIEVVVTDAAADPIIADVKNLFSSSQTAMGKIFVCNVLDAYDVSTKQHGDSAL